MMRPVRAPHEALVALASAAAYFALARPGLELALAGTASCPIWPAAGLAAAGAAAYGPSAALGVFLGSWLANLSASPGAATAAGAAAYAVVAAGSAAQALLAAKLLGPFLTGQDALASKRAVLTFAALLPLACLPGATIGVTALGAAGLSPADLYGPAWLTWWIGDAVGVLLTAPLLFAWRQRADEPFDAYRAPRRALTATGAALLLAASAWIGFGAGGLAGAPFPLSFLPFTALIWITLTADARAATTGAAALAAVVHWFSARGQGPFSAAAGPGTAQMLSSLYVALATLTALLLRAVLAERAAALEGLRLAREALERRVEAQDADLWSANASLRVAALGRREDGRRIQSYRHLVSQLPIGVTVLRQEDPRDPTSWIILEINQAGLALLHAEKENATGQRLEEFAPRIGESEFPRACADALRLNRGVELADYVSRDRSPGTRFAVKVFPLGGPLVGVVFEDVTARQSAAEALTRSNAELTQFAYVASHDLQAPLRKATAFAQQLRARLGPGLDETSRDLLARLDRSLSGMQSLIDALLQLARVATDQTPHRTVDLAAVAAEVAADLEESPANDGGRVRVGPLPAVTGDAQQLRQLLHNLVGNALKFRRPDRPSVVTVSGRALPDGFCELTIEDDGVGFDMKFAPRLFTPFQRLHSAKDYPGSGMGLAICRKIAERHGGRISIDSAEGRGTAITVALPAAAVSPAEAAGAGTGS